VALSDCGKVLLKKKFTQKQLITFTANLQTSLIGMEACSGAYDITINQIVALIASTLEPRPDLPR
jgi:hypothetical protein